MNAQVDYLLVVAIECIKKGDLNEAERLLNQALKIAPKNSEILRLMGVNFAFKKDFQESLRMFKRSIKIDPNNWLVYSNQGNVLRDLNQFEAALKSYDKTIALAPNYAEVYNNKGNLLQGLNKLELALASYDKAIALQPNYADAYNNAGNALKKLNLLDLALTAYEKAIYFDGGNDLFICSYIGCKMQLCDWTGIQAHLDKLKLGQINNKGNFDPFNLLAICEDPFILKNITQEYMGFAHPIKNDLGALRKTMLNKKMRLGYYSSDFRNHPVSYLIAGVFESCDRSKFELVAFSTGQQNDDEMRKRIKSSVDHFIDITNKSDLEVARLSREMNIDIAIDLGGLTQNSRPSIFAYRAAPIQIGYLGYLGTMASPYIDYIIADKTIIPPELQSAYSEKIIFLPSYQANDEKRIISDRVLTREEVGLPSKGFIYCCFNSNYKITPRILDSWAEILLSVDGSLIFLHAENMTVRKNLLFEFKSRKIDEERIIFAERIPREDYLARYRLADLFLDTSPYNAGTTASDALWSGLPVLTFTGRSFSSRMSSSILHAIDLPELVTSSQDEYVALAIELGKNSNMMNSIRAKLIENRLNSALFDVQKFSRNLEIAYSVAYERNKHGLPPEHIYHEFIEG